MTDKASEPITPAAGGYSAYTVLPAEGRRIAVVTCLRCGAAVLLDDDHATVIHEGWHVEQNRRQREQS